MQPPAPERQPLAPFGEAGSSVAARVAALVVNYRAYEELDECVTALERLHEPVEVVVVDHATTPERLARFQRLHPGSTVLPERGNHGFGTGMNRAAAAAPRDYFLVVNPDTIVEPDVATTLCAWLDAHPRTAVCAPRIRTESGAIEASARRFPGWSTVLGGRSTWLSRRWPGNPLSRRNLLTGPDVTRPMAVDWVSGACMLLRRSAFEEVHGFDEGYFLYWEDADLCRRLRARGWTVDYVPTATVRHLGGRSSRTDARASIDAFHASVLRYYRIHGGPFRRLLLPLVALALKVRRKRALASTGSK